tara:strand:- start:7 stop:315 length:309 start_codon:yes stop_codon:yes gene_type:complete
MTDFIETEKPECGLFQEVVEGPFIESDLGKLQTWATKNLDLTDAQKQTFVRDKRNTLISATDWWATSDRTMSAEQTAYRQALRDLTAQSGFPTDITWPTKPE